MNIGLPIDCIRDNLYLQCKLDFTHLLSHSRYWNNTIQYMDFLSCIRFFFRNLLTSRWSRAYFTFRILQASFKLFKINHYYELFHRCRYILMNRIIHHILVKSEICGRRDQWNFYSWPLTSLSHSGVSSNISLHCSKLSCLTLPVILSLHHSWQWLVRVYYPLALRVQICDELYH